MFGRTTNLNFVAFCFHMYFDCKYVKVQKDDIFVGGHCCSIILTNSS